MGLFLCFATTSYAGLLDNLTFNNTSDTLRDEGVSLFHDVDSNGLMSVGDVLQGMVQIAEIIDDGFGGVPQNSLYGIYSLQVAGIDFSKVNYIPATGSFSLGSVLGSAGLSTAGLTNFSGTIGDATFAFAEQSIIAPLPNMDAPGGALVSGGAVGGVISGVNGWKLSLVTGMAGDDFYNVLLNDPSYTSLGTLATLDPNTIYAQYRTAQSILFHGFDFPASFGLLAVDADYTAGSDLRDGHFVSSGNNLFSEASDIAAAGGWGSSSDGNFRLIAHAPEPGSALLLTTAGLLSVLRRRRKS